LYLAGCTSLSDLYLHPTAAPKSVPPSARPAPPARTVRNVREPTPADAAKTARPVLTRLPEWTAPPEYARDETESMTFSSAHGDLIDRIRNGFQLPEENRIAVATQLDWYSRNPAHLDRVFGRAALYMHHIVEEIDRRGLPMELALLPVVESAFEPFAYSKARASGLWQFIADTGTRFGLQQSWWYDGRRDVVESTRAALDYLQFLHAEFGGDWLLAVAAYNCGENCVARAVARNRTSGLSTEFWDLRLPAETRAYVPKLLAMKRLVASPASFGIEFSPIPNEPYFTKVSVKQQIDLRLAAELAGISHDEIFELNPAFHRWATPPEGSQTLLLPIDSAELFKHNVTLLGADDLLRVNRHIVQPNETLAELAMRFGTDVTTIRMINDLKDKDIRPGLNLRVPSGTARLPEKVLRAAARTDGLEPNKQIKRARPEIHVVRHGESLWLIAERNKIDPFILMHLNDKKPGDRLIPGERLVVSTERRPTPDPLSSNTDYISRVTHQVRRGETLSSIARLHGVTIAQLSDWNGITTSRSLRVGERLVILRGGRT
jgi:membrane-bound lytic murein transglycosylase D